jgi:hypothetical protein
MTEKTRPAWELEQKPRAINSGRTPLEIIRALMLVTRRGPDITTTLTREGNKSAATVGRVTPAPLAVP